LCGNSPDNLDDEGLLQKLAGLCQFFLKKNIAEVFSGNDAFILYLFIDLFD
jgi:hypothetical protein